MTCNVIVIGAGIIGASTAYQLQKAGAQVTVIDAGQASATEASFGWINASFFENADYFRLRVEGIAAYRALAQELDLPIRWSGCLCWETTGDAFDAQRDALRDVGYRVEEINATQFARLEPHVANPPARCLSFPEEAAAESGAMAKHLLEAASALGAQIIRGVRVTAFEMQGVRVAGVQTTAGPLMTDQLVAAAGTATENLMAGVGISVPMLKRPALMLKTRPVAPILSHVLATDFGEVRQLPCGALLMPASVNHQADVSESVEDITATAENAMQRLHTLIPEVPLEWSQATVAYRPVPQDGMPVVGAVCEGLYVATMHSGITLGAVMGQQIATEVLNGPTNETSDRLSVFRPQRFAQ